MTKANEMLTSISFWAKKVGLRINTGKGKTEYILVGDFPKGDIISVEGTTILQVEDYKYLGSWIMDSTKDFLNRKGEAWRAILKLDNIWKSNEFSKKMKFLFFQSLIESIFFYNATTWTINEQLENDIAVQYHKLLKYALNIRYAGENIAYKEMFLNIGYIPPVVRLRKLRLTFVGHCWRCRTYSYQSVSDLIFWISAARGNRKNRYSDMLLDDVNKNGMVDNNHWKNFSLSRLQSEMDKKENWHKMVNDESRDEAKEYSSAPKKKSAAKKGKGEERENSFRKKHVKPEVLAQLGV
jgi:hypothetical protein